MKKRLLVVLGAFILFAPSAPANAVTMHLAFTASGFTPLTPIAPPNDPVSGWIDYQAASSYAPIGSLLSISLNINSHSYSTSELSFTSLSSSPAASIWGTINGDSVSSGTNDFVIGFDRTVASGSISLFYYAIIGSPTNYSWGTGQYTLNVLAPNAVPLPATLPLFAGGFGALGLLGWRRKKKAAAIAAN